MPAKRHQLNFHFHPIRPIEGKVKDMDDPLVETPATPKGVVEQTTDPLVETPEVAKAPVEATPKA